VKKLFGRIGAILIALLFLVTSLGFSFLVIWETHQQNRQNQQQAEALKQLNQSKENQLQGKPLANFTPVAKIDKLQTIDTVVGKGAVVKAGDIVTVHYTGAVAATGTVFQSSLDTGQPVPLELKQGSVIQGWVDGIPGMRVGGTRRLLIPAALAYGATPRAGSGIPPNADLVFDVQLIKIGQ